MSATTQSERGTCAYCNGPRDIRDSVEGSYCSAACYYRARGEGVLDQLESDHRICSTCHGRVKDVEPIPEDVYAAGDGLQYPTERTVHAIDEAVPEDLGQEIAFTRWGCDCGAVDPNTVHADLQEIHLATVLHNCLLALQDLYEREAIPHPPARERYFAGLREHWRDARYAIGRAIYGGDGP